MVAVDFGAASIRVCRVRLDPAGRPPTLDVVHRAHHQPVPDAAGHLRWDWDRLVAEMHRGLDAAFDAGAGPDPVASIGIDTWGVDYGLLDRRGRLLGPPYSYRDSRTDGYAEVLDRLGARALYATTGLQVQPFNTIFQVAAHDPAELEQARHLLTLPELLVHHLTGEVRAERTSAGTTGLVDVTTGTWSAALAEAVGLPPGVLPDIEVAGTRVGTWRGVPIHLVGGHDTASAFVAMGAEPSPAAALVSAGTWMLVGRERPGPDTSEAARLANFTNEAGALGGVRFLKNLAGSWLIESCGPTWGNPPIDVLLAEAAAVDSEVPLVDVTDPRFLHPADMCREVTAAAGLPAGSRRAVVVRCIVESLAAGVAGVLDELAAVTGAVVDSLHLVGGGSRSGLITSTLTRRAGCPVHHGPVEATALGNALVQGIALGVFDGLAAARASLRGLREDRSP